MTTRRLLHETLTDIAEDLLNASVMSAVFTKSVEITVPLDIRMGAAEDELAGDLPLFRNRTAFDPQPAKIQVIFGRAAT